MASELSYKNEDDKCYGATGMAIGVVVFNGEELISAVNLDAQPGYIMEMQDEFYFNGNPGLSAKAAWQRLKANYGLSVAMIISNLMCRAMVLDEKSVDPDRRRHIHDIVAEEGHDSCGLDDDEIDAIFDREYRALYRVFNHPGVQSIAHDFASTLKRRRRLTRLELLEELRALSQL